MHNQYVNYLNQEKVESNFLLLSTSIIDQNDNNYKYKS